MGFRYFLFLRRKKGDFIDPGNRIWILIGAVFGALLGSRILGAAEQPQAFLTAQNKLMFIYGNKTIVGGLLGGLWGVELIKKWIGEKLKSGDLFVFPLLLAMIIGRIGCFSMGIYEETYGLPSRLPWALDLGDGILRHPVCLYEIIFLVLFWFALVRVKMKFPLEEGAQFKLYMIAYLAFRFLLDFIKPGERYFLGIGSIQIACLLGLLYYSSCLLRPQKLFKTLMV